MVKYGSYLSLRRWLYDQANSGLIALEIECKHFNSIARARFMIFQLSQWLIVFDWFCDNLKDTHIVKQWYHLDP
jgi:hypothetical protein